jgi:hypothetical protein
VVSGEDGRKQMHKTAMAVLALVLAIGFVLSSIAVEPVLAVGAIEADSARAAVAEYVYRTVNNPRINMVGGDWAVLGLARSGHAAPRSYYESYYKNVVSDVQAKKGVLDERKYTEFSRVILALTAAGYDARDVGGYDLTLPLGDFDKTVWQGINGPIYALLALDSAGYEVPTNPQAATQATRDMYVGEILRRQLADGGFALGITEISADPDITGMALQALAKYRDRADVKAAVSRALRCLSLMQGDFVSWGNEGIESIVQVITALCELGISVDDPRFVQGGKTLVEKLLEYSLDGGGFAQTLGGGANQLSTEQALYALAAVCRMESGNTSLYDMSDVGVVKPPAIADGAGLAGKHADICILSATASGKTFPDIQGHSEQSAIEALAARGVVGGKSDAVFDPDAPMTRAEFAAMMTRGLGLVQGVPVTFVDVGASDWYYESVRIAYAYGIINGRSATEFGPAGLMTREEAAAMVARIAGLCGMEIGINDREAQDMLAQFGDYRTASGWARGVLAFCYREGIMSQDEFEILPKEAVTRGEIAGMVYRMMCKAKML